MEKYKKRVNTLLLVMAIAITVTAMLVYTYTTSKERVLSQEQSVTVTVTVNNNQPDTSDLLDLNQATNDQLESLPGIGEALAEEIINARPFYSVEELKRVPGIGEKIYVKVRGLVKVD